MVAVLSTHLRARRAVVRAGRVGGGERPAGRALDALVGHTTGTKALGREHVLNFLATAVFSRSARALVAHDSWGKGVVDVVADFGRVVRDQVASESYRRLGRRHTTTALASSVTRHGAVGDVEDAEWIRMHAPAMPVDCRSRSELCVFGAHAGDLVPTK